MKITEVMNLPNSQLIAQRSLARLKGRKSISEAESARIQYQNFISSVTLLSTIPDSQLVKGNKYCPIQVSADSASKSVSIVRVAEPAEFVEQQGSQLFFTFNNQQVFSFPDQNHYAAEQIVAIFNNLKDLSQIQTLVGLNFVGNWEIDGQEFAPPNLIKKFK
jgi:hypothetical protein